MDPSAVVVGLGWNCGADARLVSGISSWPRDGGYGYGAWGEKTSYGKTYIGVIRSHFVIDENGKIADVQYNVKATDSPKLSLKSLTNG